MDEEKTLTEFERDVLDWILREDERVLQALRQRAMAEPVSNGQFKREKRVLQVLRQQMMAASVLGRELTGVGFYVDFAIPDDVPSLNESLGTKRGFAFGNVGAILEDANVEVGFVLFVRDGRMKMLEGYTYGGEPWPEREGRYRLFYFGERGTLSGGDRRR
jgi:hypothetical protein